MGRQIGHPPIVDNTPSMEEQFGGASMRDEQEKTMTELTDLVGKHMLDAVDFSTERVKRWGDTYEDAASCRFRLDGVVYAAVEDPSDGYRSSMEDIAVLDGMAMANVFPTIEVIGRHRTKGSHYGEDDVLELLDATTGALILEVGTENVDDYYPGYVASFHPENMAVNSKATP